MTPVLLWSNHDDVSAEEQWDFGLLHLMFEGDLWTSRPELVISWLERHPLVPGDWPDQAIVVVPARHHASPEDVAALNEDLSLFRGVLLMLIGDEESTFPWREIVHPNIRFWVMHPHPVKHADLKGWAYFFGTGFKYDTPAMLKSDQMPSKDIPWCFAGQVTHYRRKQAANALRAFKETHSGALIETEGFSQGLPRQQYLDLLLDSRVAMCPSGPFTPDTFRFYEALEAGCTPVIDIGPRGYEGDYWDFVYGETGFLFAGGLIDWSAMALKGWVNGSDKNCARWSAWWQQIKRGMVSRLEQDLAAIGVSSPLRHEVTVIVTTSPIPSHPSMVVLTETLESVWHHLGHDVRVVIACDGVRPEQKDLEDAYWAYVRDVAWHCEHVWRNCLPVVSGVHVHQAGATREALKFIDTDVILFMEHDTPLSTAAEETIDWPRCIDLIGYGSLDVLRFSHEASIHPEHEHLMLDRDTIGMAGVPLRRTVQWSQRPHLARTAYYREVLERFFPPEGSAFLEDKMYSVVQSDFSMQHRIAIYHPTGTIRRSFHSDGRAGGPKFENLQRL